MLLHLNGAPGVGKSTLAERFATDRPGVLCCDIDRLRCLVGGWEADFSSTGTVVRPLALAMIRTHLDGGRDVVLPQLLVDEGERTRFRAAAVDGGHRYVHVLLQGGPGDAATRFDARADDPLHAVIRGIVEGDGGQTAIDQLERRLVSTVTDAVHVDASGDLASTYTGLLAALEGR